MALLFDADALITPNNSWYPIEFCPAFWDLLLRSNVNGDALSIESIYTEVSSGDDQVAEWAKANQHFFRLLDQETHETAKAVAQYVHRLQPPILEPAKTEFMRGADHLLIAYAIVHGHTVVTCENLVAKDCKTVKIPNVCRHSGVPSIHPMKVLSELRGCFNLSLEDEDS
ncbi:protein of unknown function (DUF4411) [Abditibacterium utsteinense]|uniref:DUF4411 family protein n=1 Tax=Abditibacterium utsteinense TaxID=1960156 RepID=A0A2S8SQ85_9BACT|nr:DUF4411 family protein [Abditibacterium utsteinense]PQV62954.1 protein of unknown function (DUF4411) [Abditibacterium utsteinense]